jgi:hypothetical protein
LGGYYNNKESGDRHFRLVFELGQTERFVRSFVLSQTDVKEFLRSFYASDSAKAAFSNTLAALFIHADPPITLAASDGTLQPLKLPAGKTMRDLHKALVADLTGDNAQNRWTLSAQELGALDFGLTEYVGVQNYYINGQWIDVEGQANIVYEGEMPTVPVEVSVPSGIDPEIKTDTAWKIYRTRLPLHTGMKNTLALLGLTAPLPPKELPVHALWRAEGFAKEYDPRLEPYEYFHTITRTFSARELKLRGNPVRVAKAFLEPLAENNDTPAGWTDTDDAVVIDSLLTRAHTAGIYNGGGVVLFEYADHRVTICLLGN